MPAPTNPSPARSGPTGHDSGPADALFRGIMAPSVREPVGTWIFDLDNTLYPGSCRLFDQVQVKIRQFIRGHLGLDEEGALALQKRYFREHMTTLRGLMINDGIDPHAFLEFVHDIDLAGVATDPDLDRVIAALPGRKVIFTNGSVPHAERVLGKVGIGKQHFDGIFDIVASDFVPKPDIGVYRRLCEAYGIDPARAVMVDDMPRNLVPAHALGMTTILVEDGDVFATLDDSHDPASIHHTTANLAQFLAAWLATATDQSSHVER